MTSNKLKDKVMSRRVFLGTAGTLGAATLISLPTITSCKGNVGPTEPNNPIEKSVPVNLEFTVYNHTKGQRANFRKEGVLSGTSLQLSAPEIISTHNLSDVYDNAIIVRKANFGPREATSRRSNTATLKVPTEDTSYDVFLYDIDGKEIYKAIESMNWDYRLILPTFMKAFRKDFDGLTGEERVWGGEFVPEIGDYGVFDQFNRTLKPEWASFTYGKIERYPMPNDENGNIAYGFGLCSGYEANAFFTSSFYSSYWLGINPTRLTDVKSQIERGLGFLAEMITSLSLTQYLGQSTYQIVQDNGVLNQLGKDFITYPYV
jgi:hypothetical protein